MPDPVRSEAVPVRPAQEKQVANAAPSQSSRPAPGVSVASGSGCEKAPPRPSGPLSPSSASLRGACHHPPLLPTRICFRIHCHFPPARVLAPRVQGARLLYALHLTPSRCSKMFLEYVIGQTGKILVLGYLRRNPGPESPAAYAGHHSKRRQSLSVLPKNGAPLGLFSLSLWLPVAGNTWYTLIRSPCCPERPESAPSVAAIQTHRCIWYGST